MEQVIEEKIQLILPIILRNVGPLLLRGGLGGLSGGGASTSSDDDDDDDDDFNDGNSNTSVKEGEDGRKVSISLPTFPPDTDDDEYEDDTSVSTNGTSGSGQTNVKNSTELPTQDENNTITKTDDITNVSNSDSNNETNKSQITTPSTVVNTTPSTSPPLIRTSEPTTTTTTTFHPNNSPSLTEPPFADRLNPVNDESLLNPTEQSTNQKNNNDDENSTQTTELYDYSGRIDIRSDFQDDEKQPSTENIENIPTTTISYSGADPNNDILQFAFQSGIGTTDSTDNETENLVRRRRKTVIIRQHRLH